MELANLLKLELLIVDSLGKPFNTITIPKTNEYVHTFKKHKVVESHSIPA